MSNWQPGQSLKRGKYIVDRFLGEGGYGVTYRAKETSTGELVVLKTLNRECQSRADFADLQERFVNEALALANCRHDHIVRVERMFQEENLWCMVMEYVAGSDLRHYLHRHGKLSETDAIALATCVGNALSYVHEQGLLHRDIKPSNVLLRNNNLREPILIDFGLARKFELGRERTMTNARTEGFAPPEQYERHGNFGPWTDVYALAATLYELLTGEIPLPSQYRVHSPAAFCPPQAFNSSISDRANAAILAGMELAPEDRPQSIAAWLEGFAPRRSPLEIREQPAIQTDWQPLPFFEFTTVAVDARGKIVRRETCHANYFRQDLGGGITLDLVEIPGGEFTMGSPQGERDRHEDESPQHRASLPPFFLGKYLVTQAQWRAVAAMPKIELELDPDPSEFKGSDRPVERICWYDALEFCRRLSHLSDRDYRLPSETEWEYACRAGTTTPFHFGETLTSDLANYDDSYIYALEPKGDYRQQTTPVGSFPPNRWGVYDMHGNLWEWVGERYHRARYALKSSPDERTWQPNMPENRSHAVVLRGGSWYFDARDCRSAKRHRSNPTNCYYDIGFRVACTP